MISVLDYGVGNVASVVRMIERVGGTALCVATPDEVLLAKKLVIPGVGAFNYGMKQLFERNLRFALDKVALETRIPVLGICLGMQLMCRMSEEGSGTSGLGWIDAEVRRFPTYQTQTLRVPHMGWNTVRTVRENHLLPSDGEEKRFYFVHSFRVSCSNPADPIALTNYGEDFVAAFERENLFGVQFHPEKSHRFGMELMSRFVRLNFD